MEYYKEVLTTQVYSGDKPTNPVGLTLSTRIDYNSGYYALITWESSSNSTISSGGSNPGVYSQPTYDSNVILRARIMSYVNGILDEQSSISFEYSCKGVFVTPTLDEIEAWLQTFFADGVNYDLELPQKLTNTELENEEKYEVRLAWTYNDNGVSRPISTVKRGTQAKDIDLSVTVTFNGKPLIRQGASFGDGILYFDSIRVEPIYMEEVRAYIIKSIAADTGISMTNEEKLWDGDTVYGCHVRWTSSNPEIATVEDNTISISNSTVTGTLLPLKAQVTYEADNETITFDLSYTVSVVADNQKITAGKNMSQELYDALKTATETAGDLSTAALRDVTFVYLDLSEYPEITDLTGLSYCTNLRVLNISGLKIQSGMSEICTLSKLEAFIARDCGLNTLADGGAPVLSTAVNLKLLDLSYNNFSNLNSVFKSGIRYGKLSEVYLDHNRLDDISALSCAPAMVVLSLAENGLTTEDLVGVAKFPFLIYLSLANNDISSIASLSNMKYLEELRLQGNRISDVRPLKKMINLKALYLGHNQIYQNIDFLDYLSELRVLYLNDNQITDISSLVSLTKLAAINVSNNQLVSLATLEAYSDTLEEVYAENNNIARFDFVENMTGLRKLMLAGNDPVAEDYLSTYLSGLTNLETLTLSDKPLTDLSFLNGMSKLIRLEVANCGLPSYSVNAYAVITNEDTGEQSLQITDYVDNIAAVLSCKSTLKLLDISRNNMRYYQDEMLAYMEANGLPSGLKGISFKEGNSVNLYSCTQTM